MNSKAKNMAGSDCTLETGSVNYSNAFSHIKGRKIKMLLYKFFLVN